MKLKDTNKYFLYVRKSTDTEDKQVQSLDDQIRVMKDRAKIIGIKIIDTFTESMSAKAPGRYKFNEMIGRINNGEANGIIAWKLDRISRNPIDSGTIQYMLQTGKLNKVITSDREYSPIDAGLLMSVENGMSNQFIIDLRKNVKRGLDSKYLKGIRPTRVPIGYLNSLSDFGEKIITIDEKNFKIIRKAWDLILSGNYTPPKILNILTDKYGLRTRKTKRRGGKKFVNSSIYAMFHNIFYTGYYYFQGELIKGTHKALISIDEFDRVQELLGKKGNPRAKKYEFAFTGMISCGECSCSITAENKKKYIASTGKTHKYTYYHCTKKKRDLKCSQKTIRSNELEKQILEILKLIEIKEDFKDWAIDIIKKEFDSNIELKLKQSENINRAILSEERKLKKLTDSLINEILTDNEYLDKKKEVQNDIFILKEERENIDLKGKKVLDLTIDTFTFINNITNNFKNGNLETKKEILSALGKNFILKDRKILIELNPWLKVIYNSNDKIKGGLKRLEPQKNSTSKLNTNAINNGSPKWFWI